MNSTQRKRAMSFFEAMMGCCPLFGVLAVKTKPSVAIEPGSADDQDQR